MNAICKKEKLVSLAYYILCWWLWWYRLINTTLILNTNNTCIRKLFGFCSFTLLCRREPFFSRSLVFTCLSPHSMPSKSLVPPPPKKRKTTNQRKGFTYYCLDESLLTILKQIRHITILTKCNFSTSVIENKFLFFLWFIFVLVAKLNLPIMATLLVIHNNIVLFY